MLTKKFSKREYSNQAREIVARMRRDALPFDDCLEHAKKSRIARAQVDRLWFLRTYLPHYFSNSFADFHLEWDALADVKNEPVFIAAPRGHSKSTFFSLGVVLHDICCAKRHFILLISDTEDLAADFAQFIQIELEENERLQQDFGILVNQGFWTAEDFITRNGVRVKARGRGQRVRGLRNRQYRPDRVIIDDLENDKNVQNPRLVKEVIDWLLTAVLGSLAEGYSLTMVGTILSRKSVLSQMINMCDEDKPGNPRFISAIYKAIGENNKPLWPDVWTVERLSKCKTQMGSVRFNQEMLNDPVDDDGLFREVWIRYYRPEELQGKALRIYTAIDPSMTSGAHNDYKAIVTIAVDKDGIIYVLDAFIRRCSVDTMVQVAYSRFEEYHPLLIAIETNSLGEFADSPFKLAALNKSYQLPLRGIKHTTSKESRIARLSAYVERGLLRFLKGHSDQGLLVEQLIYFPSSNAHDDGPDALEMAVSLVEKGMGIIEYKSTGQTRWATNL